MLTCFTPTRRAVFRHCVFKKVRRKHNVRIAIGGFQHETNTFAPSKATFERFERGEGWPPLSRGTNLFEAVTGINIPVAGFLSGMKDSHHTLVPTAWAAASPSAHVTEDAYERIAAMIIEDLKAAMPVDAVYLDLHGAMDRATRRR